MSHADSTKLARSGIDRQRPSARITHWLGQETEGEEFVRCQRSSPGDMADQRPLRPDQLRKPSQKSLGLPACRRHIAPMQEPPKAPPHLFNRDKLRQRRERLAPGFSEYDFLRNRIIKELESRLDDTPRRFRSGLELSAAGGALSERLQATGKCAAMLAADPAPAFVAAAEARGLKAAQADEEALPFAREHFDLVLSPFSLHWVNDLPGALIRIRETLEPDGLFLGALAGAGSLAELRAALTEAETEITGGLAPRLSPLPGLRDSAALLQRAGFALPVADRDIVEIRYASLEKLFDDLRGMGERAAFAPGLGRPLRRDVLARAKEIYMQRYTGEDGRLTARFEILHLSGWAPAPGQPKPRRPGSAQASMAEAVRRTKGAPDKPG
jgi:NADH dehydrogenase [ubiquinone] 1 alpha subcomplex assembly factor 5